MSDLDRELSLASKSALERRQRADRDAETAKFGARQAQNAEEDHKMKWQRALSGLIPQAIDAASEYASSIGCPLEISAIASVVDGVEYGIFERNTASRHRYGSLSFRYKGNGISIISMHGSWAPGRDETEIPVAAITADRIQGAAKKLLLLCLNVY